MEGQETMKIDTASRQRYEVMESAWAGESEGGRLFWAEDETE